MAFFHSPNIVTDGLVSLFDAADKTSYSGSIHGGVLSTWTDIAGSNNGTITNGPTLDTGSGGSLKFDGSNDYVDCGTAAIFQTSSNVTLEVWFKQDSTGAHKAAGIPYDDGDVWNTPYVGFAVGTAAAGNTVNFAINVGGTQQTFNGSTLTTEQWHHVVQTYDGTTARGYVDGIQKVSKPSAGTISYSGSPSFIIGQRSKEAAGEYFDGNISIVRFYTKVLSSKEILQNYNAQRGRFGV